MKRKELLKAIEAVTISVDKSGGNTGMNFLMLDKNWVRGFNDTVSVSFPIDVGVFGAVKASELMKILSKMEGETIRIAEVDGKILIKDSKTTLKMTLLEEAAFNQLQENISSLNTDQIKWNTIPKDFIKGLTTCLFSAGTAPELGPHAGVSFDKDIIIATDNLRITIFTMSEKVGSPFILPTEVASSLRNFDGEFTGYSITDAWVHFKVINDTIVSVRKLLSDYPSEKITTVFDKNFPNSKKIKTYGFPEDMEKAIDRAEILAGNNEKGLEFLTQVVTLKRVGNHLIIKGENSSGEIEDKIAWQEHGDFPENIEIKISPDFLKKIIGVTRTFRLSPTGTTLMFNGKSFKHLMVAKIS